MDGVERLLDQWLAKPGEDLERGKVCPVDRRGQVGDREAVGEERVEESGLFGGGKGGWW
jgi:hypothetical protein